MIIKYILKKTLPVSKGYPITEPNFQKANEYADEREKKKYPKGYEELKKLEKTWPKDEIMAHCSKDGTIYVSARVPKHLREECAEHDYDEHTYLERNT